MALIRGEQITGSVATASFALTASYALNAGGGLPNRIVSGSVTASVDITGNIFLIKSGNLDLMSISNTGTTTLSGSANSLFLIKGANNQTVFEVSQSGVAVLATQSLTPTGTAPNGGLAFTSTDFFVGLD